jgi:LPXTG-motif cell wall-anchored protein
VPTDASGALPSTGGPGYAVLLLALALIAGGLTLRVRTQQ